MVFFISGRTAPTQTVPPNDRGEISVRRAGSARPLALPMGELARRSRD